MRQLFISHSSKDDDVVRALQQALGVHVVTAWIDSRELLPGGLLDPDIAKAIDEAAAYARKRTGRFGAFLERIVRLESGFALFGDSGFFALRFQFSKLLRRQNSFGVTEKCLAAFLRAACLHAFGLPGLNLSFLTGCEIQRGQINAFH